MASGEIPISRINAGDSVFYDGRIQVIRGRLRVSHPSRTILFTEEGRSISLTDGTLVERIDEGMTSTRYAGPSWVCGLPEKTEVASLEPGDLILTPDTELVVARLKTANGHVLITTDVVEPHASHITFRGVGDRVRLMAKGLWVKPWTGPSTIERNALELVASDVAVPAEIVFERGIAAITSIVIEGDLVTFGMHDGSTEVRRHIDEVICLQAIVELEPTRIHSEVAPSSFRCVNGHLTKSEQRLEEGQRFIECPICGLPGSAVNQPPTTAPDIGNSTVAKFCGNCGRARKSENAFCTGCGNRFSKIDTTGFLT